MSDSSAAALEAAVRDALASYAGDPEEREALTDFYIHIDPVTGTMEVTDDDDRVLGTASIPEWAGTQAKGEECERSYKRGLGRVLHRLRDEGALENVAIVRPYSFVLTDDRRETLAELMLVDDDILSCDEELMTGLDRELDEFLESLMKE